MIDLVGFSVGGSEQVLLSHVLEKEEVGEGKETSKEK